MVEVWDWDFTQIQYNYLNTHYQAGTAGLLKTAEKGLPVFIMEPLLGGKLATGLPKTAVELIKKAAPDGRATASDCVKCGKCEKLCPQHIPIMRSMEEVSQRIEPLWYRLLIKLLQTVIS